MKPCLGCGKPLRIDPAFRDVTDQPGYAGNGLFCTLRCGFRWAVRHATREAT